MHVDSEVAFYVKLHELGFGDFEKEDDLLRRLGLSHRKGKRLVRHLLRAGRFLLSKAQEAFRPSHLLPSPWQRRGAPAEMAFPPHGLDAQASSATSGLRVARES